MSPKSASFVFLSLPQLTCQFQITSTSPAHFASPPFPVTFFLVNTVITLESLWAPPWPFDWLLCLLGCTSTLSDIDCPCGRYGAVVRQKEFGGTKQGRKRSKICQKATDLIDYVHRGTWTHIHIQVALVSLHCVTVCARMTTYNIWRIWALLVWIAEAPPLQFTSSIFRPTREKFFWSGGEVNIGTTMAIGCTRRPLSSFSQ